MLGGIIRAGALALFVVLTSTGMASAASSACDRGCLVNLMNRWLAGRSIDSGSSAPARGSPPSTFPDATS